ncbi:MAG: hypothetical protein ACRDGQ_13200 [Candidatus Limnocylindrales bacterium]
MNQNTVHAEPLVVRQVFAQWTIAVPPAFDETFVAKDGYWHAWDAHRSVSLTSLVITDRKGRRISAREILRQIVKVMPKEHGEPVVLPAGLEGWAVTIAAEPSARASRAISGIVAVEGTALVATITADDLSWATDVWLSIRRCRAPRTPGDA